MSQHSTTTAAPAILAELAKTVSAPELLPIPPKGPDRIFGLSRSWWYGAERDGIIQLVRLRRPGNIRGRVLIPVERARVALEKMARDGKHLCPANHAAA